MEQLLVEDDNSNILKGNTLDELYGVSKAIDPSITGICIYNFYLFYEKNHSSWLLQHEFGFNVHSCFLH